MYTTTLSQPRTIRSCKSCKVTFVPELRLQSKCNNCLVREEIQAKIKARVAKQ
jgi:hypothetical protein